ncbi:MAG TPA: inorganic diphosphatase, partial [Sphingobacteriaceae bacterium]
PIYDKIIAVAKNDMSVNHINELEELPPHAMKEIVRFFQDYKALEKKDVTVEQLHGRDYALQVINESVALYQSTFIVNS